MYPLNPNQQGDPEDEEVSAGVEQNRESALVREGMDLAEIHSRHESADTELSGAEWSEAYDEIDQDANPRGGEPVPPELAAIHFERIPDEE